MKKIISNYKNERINETDRRIIRGLFIKNLKDFDEDFREKMKNKPLIERL